MDTIGAAVRARGWGWRHAGRSAWAVRGLDLDVEPGERILLLGASGAGKSTLLHALAGVLGGEDEGETAGVLAIDGARPEEARGRAGLLLQDPDSQVILSRVGDDVAFGCENLRVPRDEIWRRVPEALAAVGLTVPLAHPTAELSGGQKQRLALAGVLAMRPGLLLLDEPTANLDPDGITEVRDAVGRVCETARATLIVVEHRVDVWRDLVDRVVVLAPGGGILADGAPDDVLGREGARLAKSGVWVGDEIPKELARGPAGTPNELPKPLGLRPGGKGTTLLEANALSVARVPGRPAASGIDLALAAGSAVAVTGPNGAGKSTLGLTLAGLLKPAAGEVRATETLARGAGSMPHRWRSRDLLTRIGTVFQDPEHQFLAPTVRRELEVGPAALRLSSGETATRVDALLERLRLSGLADVNPFTLSGGEKRRLSVATVLATQPDVLILDEPTFGQDSRTWRELVSILAELIDDGAAVVAVTHDRLLVRALTDRELRLTATSSPTPPPAPATPVRSGRPR
jgi:energy-coupling factor transport system ATP-binding protein